MRTIVLTLILSLLLLPLLLFYYDLLYFVPYFHSFLNCSLGASDVTGSTCLHRAAYLGHSRVGRILLESGCPIDAVNLDGDAAIHIAAREVSCRSDSV